MKCFKNVFKADIRRFCNASWKFFAAFIVYCILQAVIFYTGAVKFIHKGIIDGVSFGDSMLYFFKGAKKFIIRGNTPMDIPIFGMLVVLYLLLIIALYINSDKNALGKSIIVASRSPVYWWISKCLIVVIAACVYMIIICATHFLMGMAIVNSRFYSGISLTSENTIRIFLGSGDIPQNTNMAIMLLMCLVCFITVAIVQLFITYISNAVYGFIVSIVYYVVSICYMKWFCFINYMMMYRISEVYNYWKYGFCMTLCVCAGIITAGIIYSRKRDFL